MYVLDWKAQGYRSSFEFPSWNFHFRWILWWHSDCCKAGGCNIEHWRTLTKNHWWHKVTPEMKRWCFDSFDHIYDHVVTCWMIYMTKNDKKTRRNTAAIDSNMRWRVSNNYPLDLLRSRRYGLQISAVINIHSLLWNTKEHKEPAVSSSSSFLSQTCFS